MNDLEQFGSIVERQASLYTEADLLEITDKGTMEIGQGLLSAVHALKKGITEFCEENVRSANAAWKAATSMRKQLLAPTEMAEEIIRGKLRGFAVAEEARRFEQEKKIREEQVKAAKEEREKQTELNGDEEWTPAPPPQVRVETALDSGGFRTDWRFRIVDEEQIPREYLMADTKAIGAVVKAQKERCKIPGVEIYTEKIPVAK